MLPPIANQFVAGETAATAISHARTLEEQGINPMLNLLGSHHTDRQTADADAREYQHLIRDLAAAELTAAIAVKPTQLGLDCGEDVFTDLLEDVVETAIDHGVFVWLDMEEHTTTDAILDAYETIVRATSSGHRSDERVGVCLQADLHRTPEDLSRLADIPGKIRLVKGGAYDTPETVAYTEPAAIDRAYRRLIRRAVETAEGTVAVATHDPKMIEYAKSQFDATAAPDLEFQLLMGVRPDAQRELATAYDCWQYVPYGTRWKRWAINRTKQNVGATARVIAENTLSVPTVEAATKSGLESARQ